MELNVSGCVEIKEALAKEEQGICCKLKQGTICSTAGTFSGVKREKEGFCDHICRCFEEIIVEGWGDSNHVV